MNKDISIFMPELNKIPFETKGKIDYLYTDINKELVPLDFAIILKNCSSEIMGKLINKDEGISMLVLAEQMKLRHPKGIVLTESQYTKFNNNIRKYSTVCQTPQTNII